MPMKSAAFDNLKKLYLLKTLVEQGSLNKAARLHKVTVSAISQSIKSLETSLGYPVIIRKKDGWELTEKGQLILQQSEKIFSVVSETFEAKTKLDFSLGSLSLGAYESIALEVVPALTTQLKIDFPKAKLHFQISRTSELLKKLRTGELCTVLVSQPEISDEFFFEEIYSDRLGLYVSDDSEIQRFEQRHGALIGMISPGGDGYPSFMKRFIKQIPDFNADIICDSLEVLKGLAESGKTIALLPKRIAAKAKKPLREISFSNQNYDGEHKIFLVSMKSCDLEEFHYLLKVIQKSLEYSN